MRQNPAVRLLAAILIPVSAGFAQADDEDYRIDREHPRLLLNERRLRLLKRERERSSIRWDQFELLMAGKARMAEPGFAQALYSQVTGRPEPCREAAIWASGTAGVDLRQAALVFDWCQGALSEAQSAKLIARLRSGIESGETKDVAGMRSRTFAAIALAGHADRLPENQLRKVVKEWWLAGVAPPLKAGAASLPRRDLYPLFELMHVVRDNLNLDLREGAAAFFKDLPTAALLSYYPATFPAAENDYRIPAFRGTAAPDLEQAALARAADMAMVAYDPNSPESGFLQGWLTHDRFLLRGAFGSVYEFLWANPYLPGLSYYHVPLVFYDAQRGRLLLRSSWEEDAVWFGRIEGEMQIFDAGRVTVVPPASQKTMEFGESSIVAGRLPIRFTRQPKHGLTLFFVGLRPQTVLDIEIDDEELREAKTDASGTLKLEFPRGSRPGLRIRETPPRADAATN